MITTRGIDGIEAKAPERLAQSKSFAFPNIALGHSLKRMRGLYLGIALWSMVTACGTSAGEVGPNPPGLSVRKSMLIVGESPFRGIGVNYFSLLSRLLNDQKDDSALTNLAALGKANIPFVRFMCGGYWPVEQRLYLTNREAFFHCLDRVIRCAEQNHIGLIPSLFWNLPTVPDLVGEPMQALGNTNSRSISFIRDYTADVVSRYRSSPAVWAWEFGNECNLLVDLPNAGEHRPQIVPELGTPERRTEKDELKFSQLRVAYLEFASVARKLDSHRLIVSGNSLPRAAAWHNTNERTWTHDSAEQFREVLRRDNPDPMNGISVHIYPDEKVPAGTKSISETLTLVSEECASVGKPLFVGEFGASRRAGPIEDQK